MNREIKFRVWTKNERTGEMYMTETFNLDKEFDCLSGCFDGVIMQYTGLKDKNGKEIYEGDVVLYCGSYKGIISYKEDRCKFVLKIHDSREDFDLNNICFKYEVIGHIY